MIIDGSWNSSRVTLVEICLEDLAGAAIAERAGADRIELCTNLAQGGTTPSLGTVSAVLDSVGTVGVQVLVRQRPGDFVYSALEVEAMVRDVAAIGALARPAGVTLGFVLGALTRDAAIDVPIMSRLLGACPGGPVTFHRAFDLISDQQAALELLVDLGVGRVLTAGGPGRALEGIAGLARLVSQADDRISVLAAGGVRADNVARIVRATGVSEVHLRAPASANPASNLPSDLPSDLPSNSASSLASTSIEVIRATIAALG